MEIAKLSDLIKQDIQALNVGLVDLQNLSAASKAGNKQSSSHSTTIVDSLRLRLKDATKDFQNVLQTRKESLERNKARQQQFSSAAAPDRQPLFNVTRPGTILAPWHHSTTLYFWSCVTNLVMAQLLVWRFRGCGNFKNLVEPHWKCGRSHIAPHPSIFEKRRPRSGTQK